MIESINSLSDNHTHIFNEKLSARVNKLKNQVEVLSPFERERLSDLDTRTARHEFSPSQTIDFMGVLTGVKPAAFISDFELINQYASDFSLHFFSATNELPDGTIVPWTAVSRDEQVAHKLLENLCTREDETTEREVGLMLGYPLTATNYFLKRRPTISTPHELPYVTPLSTKGTVSEEFHHFILSPDAYNDEINEYSAPLEAATKTLLPKTYESLESQYLKMKRRRKVAQYAPLFLKKHLLKSRDDITRVYVP